MSVRVAVRHDPQTLPRDVHRLPPVDSQRDAARLTASALRGSLLGVPGGTETSYAVELTEEGAFRAVLEWVRADFRRGGARRRTVWVTTPCDVRVAPSPAYVLVPPSEESFPVDCPPGLASPVEALLGLGRPADARLVEGFPPAAEAPPLRDVLRAATEGHVRAGARKRARGRVRREDLERWCVAERVEGDLVLDDLRSLGVPPLPR
jgi:hypothetical protein